MSNAELYEEALASFTEEAKKTLPPMGRLTPIPTAPLWSETT